MSTTEPMEERNKLLDGVLLLLLMMATACSHENLSPRHLVAWVEQTENGLKVEKEMQPYQYTIQYKPIDYIIAMEERRDDLEVDLVTDRRAALGDEMDYFNFRVDLTGPDKNVLLQTATDESHYYQLLDYLSYHAQKDFYLLQGADTSKCLLYNFARNYDLAPYLEFALGFERSESQDRVFVYDDKIFGSGVIKANIQQQKINRIPKLKLRKK